jgi:hypothetical protein
LWVKEASDNSGAVPERRRLPHFLTTGRFAWRTSRFFIPPSRIQPVPLSIDSAYTHIDFDQTEVRNKLALRQDNPYRKLHIANSWPSATINHLVAHCSST